MQETALRNDKSHSRQPIEFDPSRFGKISRVTRCRLRTNHNNNRLLHLYVTRKPAPPRRLTCAKMVRLITHEEASMTKKTSIALVATGIVSLLSLAIPNPAQADYYGRSRFETRRPAARQEIQQNWREIYNDRAELRRDVQEYGQDREALRRAYRRGASPAEIARLRGEVRDSAREVAQDRRELRDDYWELRRDLDKYGYDNYSYGNYDRYGNRGWWGWNNSDWWGRRYDRRDNRRDYGRD